MRKVNVLCSLFGLCDCSVDHHGKSSVCTSTVIHFISVCPLTNINSAVMRVFSIVVKLFCLCDRTCSVQTQHKSKYKGFLGYRMSDWILGVKWFKGSTNQQTGEYDHSLLLHWWCWCALWYSRSLCFPNLYNECENLKGCLIFITNENNMSAQTEHKGEF